MAGRWKRTQCHSTCSFLIPVCSTRDSWCNTNPWIPGGTCHTNETIHFNSFCDALYLKMAFFLHQGMILDLHSLYTRWWMMTLASSNPYITSIQGTIKPNYRMDERGWNGHSQVIIVAAIVMAIHLGLMNLVFLLQIFQGSFFGTWMMMILRCHSRAWSTRYFTNQRSPLVAGMCRHGLQSSAFKTCNNHDDVTVLHAWI